MGHQRAALALARAFAALPDTTALVHDTLDYSHSWFRRGYAGVYLGMAALAPRLWSRYYAQTDRPNRLMDGVRALSTRIGVHEIAALIDRAQSDAIVCTHFLPLEALAQLPQQHLPPIYSVVTDYHAHHFWACPGVARHFVPTAATQQQLVAAGVDRRGVEVTGIPIDPAIGAPIESDVARHALGLPADGPVVALIGSGLPTEQVRAMVVDVLAQPALGSVVVAAGRNHDLLAGLDDLAQGAHPRLRVLGPQPSLTPLLAASDLVVSKAGGLTVSEVLTLGVPMIIPTAQLVGQERWNAAYMIEAGAGLGCRSSSLVAQTIAEVLAAPERLARMRTAAKALGRAAAAETIAARVLADLEQRPAHCCSTPHQSIPGWTGRATAPDAGAKVWQS
jgi:processive 1,2-diacylglycerol beta-glucosyltransferase